MQLKLYYVEVSHPANTARLMLDHKGLTYRRVDIRPGFQPFVTKRRRFDGVTVPALEIDGRRVQGTIPIGRALDQLCPDPPLFPGDPGLKREVEAAEAWGESEFQPVPRNLFRLALCMSSELRRYFVSEMQHLRPAGLIAKLEVRPIARTLSAAGATEESVRAELGLLPGMLDRIRALLDAGVLGRAERNAADFQIATTIRAVMFFDELRALVEDRSLASYARSVWPDIDVGFRAELPAEWIPRTAPVGPAQ